jgi:hypothetical protein
MSSTGKARATKGKPLEAGVAKELLEAVVNPVHFRKKFQALKEDARFPLLYCLNDRTQVEQARQRHQFLQRQSSEKLARLCQESDVSFDEQFLGM